MLVRFPDCLDGSSVVDDGDDEDLCTDGDWRGELRSFQ
jgi:hypothetical protein